MATSIPEIESARLRLRPFREADVAELHRLWTDPGVRKYLWDDEVIPLARAASTVSVSVECARRHGVGMWCVLLRPAGPLVGFCGFRFIPGVPEPELLYGLAPEYCGRGLATEAARAALTFIFATRPDEKILAGADAPNLSSFRVMRRLGMRRREGGLAAVPGAVYYEISRGEFVPDPSVVWRREEGGG